MDLHGSRDRTCPANSTTSSDGWNYTPVDEVMKVWAQANGCTGTSTLTRYEAATRCLSDQRPHLPPTNVDHRTAPTPRPPIPGTLPSGTA